VCPQKTDTFNPLVVKLSREKGKNVKNKLRNSRFSRWEVPRRKDPWRLWYLEEKAPVQNGCKGGFKTIGGARKTALEKATKRGSKRGPA